MPLAECASLGRPLLSRLWPPVTSPNALNAQLRACTGIAWPCVCPVRRKACACLPLTFPQEKSKLEAQVKQLVSQKQLLDRSQGKQESIEQKKRESIMLVSGKYQAGWSGEQARKG